MKIPTNFINLFLLSSLNTFQASAAVIGSQAHSRAPNPLAERAVTYGLAPYDAKNTSLCDDEQRRVIEQGMRDAVRLAKAGADGLAIILDMLTEERTEFNKLIDTEQHRYQATYSTFFGTIDAKSQWQLFRDRASFIKASLDRLSLLTIETWPKDIIIYCDSSYYQDKDGAGKTLLEVFPDAVSQEGTIVKFDSLVNRWLRIAEASDCSFPGSGVYGFTTQLARAGPNGTTVPVDRITFCPYWFSYIKSLTNGKSTPTAATIQRGTSLGAFVKKAGRG